MCRLRGFGVGQPWKSLSRSTKEFTHGEIYEASFFSTIMHLDDSRYIYNFERWKCAWLLMKLAVLVVRLNC